MINTFREYHQFSESEFPQLWKNGLFVFDTNTLLNFYRYKAETAKKYFMVLDELKFKNQIWIPYQVGYEFYENRVDIICEFQKSYENISSIIKTAISEICGKYKYHPLLDLDKITNDLTDVTKYIQQKEQKHPNLLQKDEILQKILALFEGNTGKPYDESRLIEIFKEGKTRYERKIPPGFNDVKKPENKRYGDLVLWYQIIDEAKERKKPIILISNDVKDDWWLIRNGKHVMPLPQLKKEIYEKASVDFHIYTADRFLKYSKVDKTNIDEKMIKEVKCIRENENWKNLLIYWYADIEKLSNISPSDWATFKNIFRIESPNRKLMYDLLMTEYKSMIEALSNLLAETDFIGTANDNDEYILLTQMIEKMKHNEIIDKNEIKQIEQCLIDVKNIILIFERFKVSAEISSPLIDKLTQRLKNYVILVSQYLGLR